MKRPTSQTEFSPVDETAANWFARRRDGFSPADQAKFQAWLEADPRHAAAIADLQIVWDAVSVPVATHRADEAGRILDGWETARRRRRYAFATAGLAAAAALMVIFLPNRVPHATAPAPIAFAVRPNIRTLPDGSTAELNANADIVVEFTPEKRAVRLIRGEALFAVMKNAACPFVVSAGGIEVRAVGTKFSVRVDLRQVGVLVTEGRVAVEDVIPRDSTTTAPSPRPAPIYLSAGGKIAVAVGHPAATAPAVKPLSPEEISAALAWRGKRVEFSRMPLSDAVALFNRQNRMQLTVVDPAIGTMPISGIFWADDPEAFARLLESGLGVRVERLDSTLQLGGR